MKRILISLAILAALLAPEIASADYGEVRALATTGLQDEGLGPAAIDYMLCIAFHESTFRQYVVSPTNDHGVWQFHMYRDGHTDMINAPYGDRPYDVYWASRAAGYLYLQGEVWRWTARALC